MEQYKCIVVDLGHYNNEKSVLIEWDYADIDFFPDTKMQLEFADKWYECKKE